MSSRACRSRTRATQQTKCSVIGPTAANDSSAAMANPHSRHGTEPLASGPSGIMRLRILHQQCRVEPLSEMGSVTCNLHPVGGGGCAADTQISDGNRQAGRGSIAPNVTGAVSRGGDSYPLDRICDLYPCHTGAGAGATGWPRVARSASSQPSVNVSGRLAYAAPERSNGRESRRTAKIPRHRTRRVPPRHLAEPVRIIRVFPPTMVGARPIATACYGGAGAREAMRKPSGPG